jgi:putative MATE family efflux protein
MFKERFIGDRAFYQKVIKITVPILIQNVITNFVNLLDNVMVGRLGTELMSGVAIVNQLLFIFNLCVFGGLSGAGIFSAQYKGKGDMEGVRHTFRFKLLLGGGLAVIFVLLYAFCGGQLVQLFIHQGEEALDLALALESGKSYMIVMLFGLIPFTLSQCYASTLKETGETMLPMKAGVAAVVVNFCLNYVLIFGKLGMPALGVVGAAIATLIARITECLILVIWTHRHKERAPFVVGLYRSMRIPKELVSRIARKAMPLMLNEVLWSVGMTTLTQCYSTRGLEAVSANNIASTISNLFFCAIFAFGNAISIIVGHRLGAGELDKAKEEDTKLIFCSVAACFVVGGLMALAAPFIPQVYEVSDGVRGLATSILWIVAAMMPFHGFTNCAYFTLRTGGQTLVTFFFDAVFMWVLCIPLAFCLSRLTNLPMLQLFACVTALDLLKCFIGFVLLRRGVWMRNLVSE